MSADDATGTRLERELETTAARLRLLLEAARQLGEIPEPAAVYDRFHDLLADRIPHDGVVVSSYDPADGLIRCEYAWVEGARIDPSTLPPLPLNPHGGGMQSRVIRTGEPLLVNDVPRRVEEEPGTYYNVDRAGTVRPVPESGPAAPRAAMMVPVKHEGRVVGVVQLMSDAVQYARDDLELFEGLVAQTAAAVRNARLHAERRRLEAATAAAQAASRERERAAHVLEAVGEGIFLVDGEGAVRLWNRAAAALTGHTAGAVLGRAPDAVFPAWRTVSDRIPVAEGEAPARSVTLPVEVGSSELWLSFVAVRSAAGVVYARSAISPPSAGWTRRRATSSPRSRTS